MDWYGFALLLSIAIVITTLVIEYNSIKWK
jgi:hypothetical protein